MIKKYFIAILFASFLLHTSHGQEDSALVIPRSFDASISIAPAYVLSSSEGGSDPSIYPSLASARLIQTDLIWDGFISYRGGYGYQQFELAYNTSIGGQDERLSGGEIAMHAAHLAIGQAQYFNISQKKGDHAFVVTPWIGVRSGFLQSFSTPNQRLEVPELDTTLQGFASYRVFEQDSLSGYSFQRREKGNFTQFQMTLSLAFELRVVQRVHLGLEPFVNFGFQPMYRQYIDYEDFSSGVNDQQVLLSRGTNYGVRFSLRVALWEEKL